MTHIPHTSRMYLQRQCRGLYIFMPNFSFYEYGDSRTFERSILFKKLKVLLGLLANRDTFSAFPPALNILLPQHT